MSDFSRAFLNEDWGSRTATPRVYLGAFGKHPGWNDHMDDVGLTTHSLATFRRVLYGSGIAAQIEGSAWDNQDSGKVLAEFDHVFCWRRPVEMIVGRIWTSRDGKGRSLYPMIVAAHCIDVPFDAVAKHVLSTIERVCQECRATTVAADVITSIDLGQTEARNKLNGDTLLPKSESTLGVPAWTHHYDRNRSELMRLFYHLTVQFHPFSPSAEALWSVDSTSNRSRQIRVPVLPGAQPAESFNTWLRFFGTQLDASAPLFAVSPCREGWMDLIIGEPVPGDFFALRAGPLAVPLVTAIPYQVDSALIQRLEPIFASLREKEMPAISILNGQPVEANHLTSQRWLAKQRPSGRGFFNRFFRAS